MGEITFVGTGDTRGYPYLVCKKCGVAITRFLFLLRINGSECRHRNSNKQCRNVKNTFNFAIIKTHYLTNSSFMSFPSLNSPRSYMTFSIAFMKILSLVPMTKRKSFIFLNSENLVSKSSSTAVRF